MTEPADDPPPHADLPKIDVSPPARRSFFRFGLLGFLLFTTVLAIAFSVGSRPHGRDNEKYPFIYATKRGMHGRTATYEVRYGRQRYERYESRWEGDVETLTSVHVQDDGGRTYTPDSKQPQYLLTDGHQQAFDAVRAIVRSKVDFDAMRWADDFIPPGRSVPTGPFTVKIHLDESPPHAESFVARPAPSPTGASSPAPTQPFEAVIVYALRATLPWRYEMSYRFALS